MEGRQIRVVIVGAGLAGNLVLQTLRSSQEELVPLGFVDDDPQKAVLQISGLPVLGTRFEIPEIVDSYRVDEIIIALPSASPAEVSKIIEICKTTSARIKILPGIYDLNTGKIRPSPIRDVQLEDLLGRKPLTLDTGEIIKYINDQVVLVTGAGGSVGTELSTCLAKNKPRKLILMGRGENSIYEVEQKLKNSYPLVNTVSEIADIRDHGRITRLFKQHKPGVVFHTAAHKHVPYMEKIPEEAVKNNIIGTKILCEVARANNCKKFILISTDKAVKPVSIMGATKRVAEMLVTMMNGQSDTKFAAVRFGNVMGSRGSVIPLFEKQISLGGPVTVTHPGMMRYFMTVNEAAQLVIQAGAMARGGEIFVLDMGEPVCIKDLAYKLIRLQGLEPEKDILIKYTGIRPGEKIFEILVGEDEEVRLTGHDKIFAVFNPGAKYDRVEKLLGALHDPHFSYEDSEIRSWLKNFMYS